jgi:diaminopimelate epimerase
MSPKPIPFVKAEACGNDFLIVESGYLGSNPAELSRRLCDRHRGVGADGVEWVSIDAQGRVVARLFNADGSEAEISGNGTRCVAAWAVEARGGSEVQVLTGAGEKECMLLRRSEHEFEFMVEMGRAEIVGEKTIQIADANAKGLVVSTGNPHFVEFVDEFSANWQKRAAAIGESSEFPQGVNVEFVRILRRNKIEFRARSGRNPVFRNWLLRFRDRRHPRGQGGISGRGACARRKTGSPLGRSRRSAARRPGTVGVPGRVVISLKSKYRLLCDKHLPLEHCVSCAPRFLQ